MNRKLISKAISDIEDSFIAEAMSPPVANAGHTPERTKHMGKYEETTARKGYRRFFATVCAACFIFAMAITAYAANWFGIREMFHTVNRELPEAADPFIQQHTETAAAEDWSARVTESLCDTGKILTTVTVFGGDKYILAPTDGLLTDSAGMIVEEDSQALAEYAESQGKELLFVGATLMQNRHLGIFTETQICKRISDSELTILVESGRSGGDAGGEAVCRIYARDEAGNRKDLEVPITLEATPSDGERVYMPVDPDAIPGLTVSEATVKETPLGLSVRWMETVTDQEALYNIKKTEIEGVSYREGGSVLEDDGNCYFQFSMGEGSIGDTMVVHFYDWDDQLIGDIVFMEKE